MLTRETHQKEGNCGHFNKRSYIMLYTSEIWVWFPPQPQVGKLVVACGWLAVYSSQNLDQLHVLVFNALPTTHRDITCTVLKAT